MLSKDIKLNVAIEGQSSALVLMTILKPSFTFSSYRKSLISFDSPYSALKLWASTLVITKVEFSSSLAVPI